MSCINLMFFSLWPRPSGHRATLFQVVQPDIWHIVSTHTLCHCQCLGQDEGKARNSAAIYQTFSRGDPVAEMRAFQMDFDIEFVLFMFFLCCTFKGFCVSRHCPFPICSGHRIARNLKYQSSGAASLLLAFRLLSMLFFRSFAHWRQKNRSGWLYRHLRNGRCQMVCFVVKFNQHFLFVCFFDTQSEQFSFHFQVSYCHHSIFFQLTEAGFT